MCYEDKDPKCQHVEADQKQSKAFFTQKKMRISGLLG